MERMQPLVKQPTESALAIRCYWGQHTRVISKQGHTLLRASHRCCGRAGSKGVALKQRMQGFGLEEPSTDGTRLPFNSLAYFLLEGAITQICFYIFMFDLRIPTGDSVSFPFWFFHVFQPTPVHDLSICFSVSRPHTQVPLLYTFALSKWKRTQWVKFLSESCWRWKGYTHKPYHQLTWKVYLHFFCTRIPSHLPHFKSMVCTSSFNRKFNVTNHYIFYCGKDRGSTWKSTFPFSR